MDFVAKNGRLKENIFRQDNVSVSIAGPLSEEVASVGIISIYKEAHGFVVEWHSTQRRTNENSSSESDSLDWEHLDSTTVGYKAKVETDSDTNSSGLKPISFDVAEIKSFKRVDKKVNDKIEIIFTVFLKDGTNIPSFYFESMSSFLQFILALEKLVTITRSKKDNSLYLVGDKNSEALEKSFSELELFDDNKTHIVTKFFQNPVETAMGGFSRVTNLMWGNFEYILHNESATGSPSDYSEEKVIEMLHDSMPDVDINHLKEPGYEFVTCIEMPPRQIMKREDPVTVEEWQSHFDSEGKATNINKLKMRIFKGGLMHSVRTEAWKFLLGYYAFDSTQKERELIRKHKIDDYYRMKLQWMSMTDDQVSRFSAFRDRRNLIGKDVNRTDRTHPFFEGDNNSNVQMLFDILMTYCMYNFDLGYVQGMSDLLSPILVVMQNEADSFWCFSQWMDFIGTNFELDQQGMKSQLQNLHRLLHFVDSSMCTYLETHDSGNLYFAFRWLLILFKRDFKFQEIMRLWEVLWTSLPCKNFHLLICLAILDTEKLTIMENMFGLTEILKHINDLAYKINLDETLCKAESIYHQIVECSHLSDIVQNILGLDIPLKYEAATKKIPCDLKMKTVASSKTDPHGNANSSGSSVDLESYVDLEHHFDQCDSSFNLFT